jgi:hypothetical protein
VRDSTRKQWLQTHNVYVTFFTIEEKKGLCQAIISPPDAPSRHHLPFDRLMALSKAEGRRCLRSLLPPPPAFAGAGFAEAGLRRIAPYASVVSPRRLASNTSLVIRVLHNLWMLALIPMVDDGLGSSILRACPILGPQQLFTFLVIQ